MSSEELIFCRV